MDIDPESIKVSLHTTAPQDTSGPVMQPPTVSWGDAPALERIISIAYGHQVFVDRNVVISECIRAVEAVTPVGLAQEQYQSVVLAALESLKEQP